MPITENPISVISTQESISKDMPDISVIVVTYNQESTIARCLESIVAQRFNGRMEIVIGEDGSNDATAEICRKYQTDYPDRIRLYCNRRNKGLIDNYFDTMLNCTGRYLADCAGDDSWSDPYKLQKQFYFLEQNSHVGLVHTAWEFHDIINGQTIPYRHNSEKTIVFEKGKILMPLLNRELKPYPHLSTALWRRDAMMAEYLKDPQLFRHSDNTCEDLQIIAAMASRMAVAYLPDKTLLYSVGHKSVSSEESFSKTFDFYIGTVRLTRRLHLKYAVADGDMRLYYRNIMDFLAAQIIHGHLTDRVTALRSLADYLPFRPSAKYRLIMAAMRFKGISWVAAKLYHRISKRKVVKSLSDAE